MPDSHRLTRREFLAAVVGTSAVAGGLVGGSTATFTDSETDSGSLTTGVWGGVDSRTAYTAGGSLTTVTDVGGTTGHGLGNAAVLGPVDDRFGATEYDVPVLQDDGTLSLVDEAGGTRQLDLGGTTPRTQQSLLATAEWNGHPISVYYATGSDIYRVAPGTAATKIETPSNGATAVLGARDFDGDGTAELVFIDGSATVRYLSPADGSSSRRIDSTGISTGGGYGAGEPRAVADYGVVVPAVNGSGGLGLLGPNGWAEKSLTEGSTAAKAPVHACDFDGDNERELVFVATDDTLRYLDDVGGTNDLVTITDSSGSPITADTGRGAH